MKKNKKEFADENRSSENQESTQPLAWEAPKLYKEEWLNTLGGTSGSAESVGSGNPNKRRPSIPG